MGLTFEAGDEDKLQRITATIGHSKATSSNKSMFASWISYFDEGEGSRRRLVLEALVAYLLSWFILPSVLEDGMNSYVFPLMILLAKGKKVTLAPVY